ncbi:nitrile hydratase subunit beta [Prauserella halophila]|uniref:nitrile hydratase subunit beta n=1 Tax=Prauserella halophila TaxID=185641 RepID=UPI0020A31431|nr:nitrile hydratase subunit beta [Prauserella halophila]MCP2238238.1 nitrile hydratase [Prauserella halophila]
MDGVHDLGGRQGIGAVRPEPDEPVFHSDWERSVLTMFPAMAMAGAFNLDQFRAAMERIPAAEYLATRYFEHWIHSMTEHGVRAGIFDPQDLERRTRYYQQNPQEAPPKKAKPEQVDALRQMISNGDEYRREVEAPPIFEVGDQVRVKPGASTTHTRRAGYVRGKAGEIVGVHGAYVFPDTNAIGGGDCPEHLYTVRFTGAELWGDEPNAANTIVHIDQWEPYLTTA